MRGVAVGRVLDLTTLDGYDQLIDELEKQFDIKGQLQSRNKWEIVFTDEGDMMLVGDDQWQYFIILANTFCLHFEAFQLGIAPVYMEFLRFMGDEKNARTYTYNLEVGVNGRKLIWEGTPRSIRDSHRNVRDSHDGLIIQRNMPHFSLVGIGRN